MLIEFLFLVVFKIFKTYLAFIFANLPFQNINNSSYICFLLPHLKSGFYQSQSVKKFLLHALESLMKGFFMNLSLKLFITDTRSHFIIFFY